MAMQSLRAMSFFVICNYLINADKPIIWLNCFHYFTTFTTYK